MKGEHMLMYALVFVLGFMVARMMGGRLIEGLGEGLGEGKGIAGPLEHCKIDPDCENGLYCNIKKQKDCFGRCIEK